LTWNAGDLTRSSVRELDLLHLLEDTGADVAAITEAELPHYVKFSIPGYKTFLPQLDGRKKYRLIMLVKSELAASASTIFNSPMDIWVQITPRSGPPLAIAGVYRLWRTESGEREDLSAFHSRCEEAIGRYSRIVVAGDFNLNAARPQDISYTRRAMLRHHWATMAGIGLSYTGPDVSKPTFVSHGKFGPHATHRTSVLDHVYAAGVDVKVDVLPFAASDHHPVVAKCGLALTTTNRVTPRNPLTRTERNYKRMDVDQLNMALLDQDWSPYFCSSDVNACTQMRTTAISNALDISSPRTTYKDRNCSLKLAPDTREAMRARDWARHHSGKGVYRQLRNRALRLVRRDRLQGNLARVRKGGSRAAWQIVREVDGTVKSGLLPLPRGCTSSSEAAQAANNFYRQKILDLRSKIAPPSGYPGTAPPSGGKESSSFSFQPIGASQLKAAARALQAKRACGVDGIPITVIKAGLPSLTLPLVHLANTIINSGRWPETWKEATVVPVLKPGKPPLETASYRPVSLLCALSKLMERVLYDQLSAYVESQRLLPDEQHGFRPGRGLDSALAIFLTQVSAAKQAGDHAAVLAFDYSAAFDTIDHSTLLQRMEPWMGDRALQLVRSYLDGGSQRVKWNGSISNRQSMRFGVRQGSILGPLLFIILTSTLPSATRVAGVQCCLYADDTSALIKGASWQEVTASAQLFCDKMASYSAANGLALNLDKTQLLYLGGHKGSISVGKQTIEPRASLSLLGVSIDSTLRFNLHHETLVVDLRRRLGAIRRMASHLPRGKLLNEIAQALFVGRLQSCAWVTHLARLTEGSPSTGEEAAIQVLLNDVARALLGLRRSDKVRRPDLLLWAGLPALNEVVVRGAAMAAWRAARTDGPLRCLVSHHDPRTRAAAGELIKPCCAHSTAGTNMASCWNRSPALRAATTQHAARTAARRLAGSMRAL